MKQILLIVLGLIVVGMVAFTASPATAINGYGLGYPPIPSWSQTLSAYSRFVVLINMNYEAVLDKETGLVWEKSPSTSTFTWYDAQSHCNGLTTGGRLGWRLPTLQELASLVDPTHVNPPLPIGHPFSSVQTEFYWSATTVDSSPSDAWDMNFYSGTVTKWSKSDKYLMYVWCVRGGQGVDHQ
jgi:hypothetical protein